MRSVCLLLFSFFYPSLRYRSHKVFPLLFTNRRLHYYQTPQKSLYIKTFQRFFVLYPHLVNKLLSVFKLVNKLPAYLLNPYPRNVHFFSFSRLWLSTLESVKNPYISRLFGVFSFIQLQHLYDDSREGLFTKYR